MSYNDFLGLFSEPDEKYSEELKNRSNLKMPEHDYENVRFGLPHRPIKFDAVKDERLLLLRHYISNGYSTFPSSKLHGDFKKAVSLFRASLDLWESLCGEGSMSKDEIYYRCLSEGPSFTDWVKKARAMSLMAHCAETNVEIDEDYLLSNYKGYNSLLAEDYLIHWDDTSEIDDIKYAFIDSRPVNEGKFRKDVKTLFKDFRISECEFPNVFDMISSMKNTSMYDPVTKKSALMREFWNEEVEPFGPYFACRRVVPVKPGGTRDTGVGDPSTILKVKQLNALARVISEKLPYSANAPEEFCNARYKRVLRRNAFLHLDFKKFGLTVPRVLSNIMIEEIGVVSGIDTSHLIIKDFYIEIDGETYQTHRGNVLGWIDTINCLCVIAILHRLAKEDELGFDFVGFNDDFEISKYVSKDIPGTLELLKLAIVSELDSFDIAISLGKTYGSKASVFLERYAYFDQYGLDMYKEQLTVKAYSKSLCTEYPWQAKIFHAAAEQWTKNEYATDRCIKTCPVEFRPEEASTSLWSGGWFVWRKDGLDLGMLETDRLGFHLGTELSKFKNQNYSVPTKTVSSHEKICNKVQENVHYSYSAESGKNLFSEVPRISDINSDIELIRAGLETFLFKYEGRNDSFPLRVSWLVERSLRDREVPNI
jgi:hypothetical protein